MIHIGEGRPQFRIYSTIRTAHSYDDGVFGMDGATQEGWLNPKFAPILMPFCETLIEKFTPNQIVHELQHGKDALTQGYNYEALLKYDEFLSPETLKALSPLFKPRGDMIYIAGDGSTQVQTGSVYQIYFVPRFDRLNTAVGSHTNAEDSRAYRVFLDDSFSLQLIPGQGHKGFSMKLVGMDIIRNMDASIGA